MAELDRAKVVAHKCAGPFKFNSGLPVPNRVVIKGIQNAEKPIMTMAAVQATHIFTREFEFLGSGQALEWFICFFALCRNITISR